MRKSRQYTHKIDKNGACQIYFVSDEAGRRRCHSTVKSDEEAAK